MNVKLFKYQNDLKLNCQMPDGSDKMISNFGTLTQLKDINIQDNQEIYSLKDIFSMNKLNMENKVFKLLSVQEILNCQAFCFSENQNIV